jgi:hypothetical protein
MNSLYANRLFLSLARFTKISAKFMPVGPICGAGAQAVRADKPLKAEREEGISMRSIVGQTSTARTSNFSKEPK